MVSTPALTPVTTPADMVAFPFDADHVPPVVASVNVVGAPIHIVDEPDMEDTVEYKVIVTGVVATTVPQILVTE